MWISLEDPNNTRISELANSVGMQKPVAYERISYYDAYKKANYVKKKDALKITKLEDTIIPNDYILVDEVFRMGWHVVEFDIYMPSKFGKFNLNTKIKVNSPEGFDMFVEAECVVGLLAQTKHTNGVFENRLRLNPENNWLELESELEESE